MNRVKYLTNKNLHRSMSIECMTQGISLHVDAIDVSKWLREDVPAKHRLMCTLCVRRVFDRFEGKKAISKSLSDFIRELHEEIKKEIQSRAD